MSGIELTLVRDKPEPWGFRLQGGVDFEKALTVVFVNEGSHSYNSGLRTGDVILKIGDLEGVLLTHKEAQEAVIEQGNSVRLTVKRQNGGPPTAPQGVWKPEVQLVGGPATVPGNDARMYTKTSLALPPQPQEEHFDVKHNITAKGFQPGAAPSQVKSVAAPVTKDSVAAENNQGVNGFRSVSAPQSSGMSAGGRPVGAPVCWVCSKPISGIFLQAKGQPLHAECFSCSACGISLRNVGHFVIGGSLYCQTHAREAQNKLQGKSGDGSESAGQPPASQGPAGGGGHPVGGGHPGVAGHPVGGGMPSGLAANLAKLTMKQPIQKGSNGIGGSNNISSGNNNIPSGNNNIPSGNNNIPRGNYNIPSGKNNIPSGNNNIPSGNIGSGGNKSEWEKKLNASTPGMASNAEDFTKEFMKELMGGTGV